MGMFDFINYLKLNDVQRASKNQDKLDDLQERAAFLARQTGEQPISWYEFKKSAPRDDVSLIGEFIKGALITAVIGAGIAAIFSLVTTGALVASTIGMFAVSGGLIGGFANLYEAKSENRQRGKLIESYTSYLDAFENKQQRSMAMDRAASAGHTSEQFVESKQPIPTANRSSSQQR